MQKLLALYFIVVNIISFSLFAYDKFIAASDRRRVSEKRLHFFSFIGGFVGSSLSMLLFHHKVKKASFLFKHALIIFIWIVWLLFYFTQLNELNFLP